MNRERVREIAARHFHFYKKGMGAVRAQQNAESAILQALREFGEEMCKRICSHCNNGIPTDGAGRHILPHFIQHFDCKAYVIRAALAELEKEG